MAAPMKHVFSKVERLMINKSIKRFMLPICSKKYYSINPAENDQISTDQEALFVRSDVQEILKKVTGISLDKVFAERQTQGVHPPKYKLFTNEQLAQVEEETLKRAEEKLQMPPVMKARDEALEVVLSDDVEIEAHETHNIVFTDITYGLHDRSRAVVVREPGGKLRLANPSERHRMLQVYFPQEGKSLHMPSMFEEQNLEKMLSEQTYMYILERACVQFEPDDSHFIRVCQRVYEHIDASSNYDLLRSTRFFGGMAFYLALYKKIDGLILDMLRRNLLADAEDMVHLYHILHPNCESAKLVKAQSAKSPNHQLQMFIEHDARRKGELETALQVYNESQGRLSISGSST